jgi:predicted ATPase
VRIGLHTGAGNLGGDDYVGLDVHRAARISDAGHGGQIVVSEPTALLVERILEADVTLIDLGKHRLKDLSEPETLFQVQHGTLESQFPPLRTLDLVPNNLPPQVTSFIGRADVLNNAANLLARTRILTLTGPGGTGKTRLSLQLAADASEEFSDGVFFVDLSSVLEVEVVPSAILAAVGLRASGHEQSPYEHLVERIAGKQVLLVLDNFEHLLGAAGLVSDMARVAPDSKFLITTRAPLRIQGEQEMPVPPLSVDSDSSIPSEAVQLFVERAMAVKPSFVVDESNKDDIPALVGRLDGLPLAIELVASRVKLLPVSAILQRLDSSMLGGGSTDRPERQRTIAGAIDWSYQLLDREQAKLLERLSVFVGGAGLGEIEQICADSDNLLDRLSELVDHSLIRVDVDSGPARFRMLFVIQEYARERLAEHQDADGIRRAHLETYTELVEGLEPDFLTANRREVFDAIEREHDNIRAALDWGLNREVDLVLRLSAAMWRYWQTRGHLFEGQRRIEVALEQQGGRPPLMARTIEALGGVLWWRGDLTRAMEAYTTALELTREFGQPADVANALYNLALGTGFEIGVEDGLRLLDEAQTIYESLGDTNGLGDIAWGRGNLLTFSEDYVESSHHLVRSADLYRQAGNEFGMGWAMFEVGGVALRMGDPLGAWPSARDGLQLFAHHNDVSAVVLFLTLAAGIAYKLGDLQRAYRAAGAFHGLRISSGTDLATIDFNVTVGLEFETLEALDPGPLRDAYEAGKKLTYERAIEYALSGPGIEVSS